jgi:argininosuccinate synthase
MSALSSDTSLREKVVLAYSGGLDTTVIIPWLQENVDCEIIAVCVDVGLAPGKDKQAHYESVKERALASGAAKAFVIDASEEFVAEYILPCLKAGAIYEGHYLLGTSMARPLIAKKLIEVAKQEGCKTICHGATGKGNDQVRFELAIQALAPDFKVIAPWRIWDIGSREDAIAYLERRGMSYPVKHADSYSRDQNVWHLSHEGLELEDPANTPDYKRLLQLSVSPQDAPEAGATVEITFKQGVPTHVDGKAMPLLALLEHLNTIAGAHGIGIVDMVENRVVGLKARGVYETPGGTLLYRAHDQLEQLCLDARTRSTKQPLAIQYAELVYGGLWFTPLRECLDAFMNATQRTVTGTVKLKLYKGNVIPAGMTSPYSLYDQELASFTTGELYRHSDAEGFITLYGLPSRVQALMMAKIAEDALEGANNGLEPEKAGV